MIVVRSLLVVVIFAVVLSQPPSILQAITYTDEAAATRRRFAAGHLERLRREVGDQELRSHVVASYQVSNVVEFLSRASADFGLALLHQNLVVSSAPRSGL